MYCNVSKDWHWFWLSSLFLLMLQLINVFVPFAHTTHSLAFVLFSFTFCECLQSTQWIDLIDRENVYKMLQCQCLSPINIFTPNGHTVYTVWPEIMVFTKVHSLCENSCAEYIIKARTHACARIIPHCLSSDWARTILMNWCIIHIY